MSVEDLKYLIKLLDEEHLRVVAKSDMENIVTIKSILKKMIWKLEDEEYYGN